MSAWSSPVFARVAQLLAAQLGLSAPADEPAAVESRIRRAMVRAGAADAAIFLAVLERGEAPDDLVTEFTVGESYFLREPGRFDWLRREGVPSILERRPPGHALRIWSAGCAGGEEPYSVAMLLEEAGLPGQVLATDVSEAALRQARAGVYRHWALRGAPDEVIGRAFERAAHRWRIRERYRARVRFVRHNLVTARYPTMADGLWEVDLILCRNVFIYLDTAAIHRVARGFADTLAEGGWLLTGASDPWLDIDGLDAVMTNAGLAYRRARLSATAPALDTPRARKAPVVLSTGTTAHATSRPAPRHPPDPAGPPVPAAHDTATIAAACLREAATLLDAERHEEAISTLRRVLYLDRSIAVGHYLLGVACARRGRADAARRAWRRARALAAALPKDAPLPLADGAAAGTLVAAAEAELARLAGRTRAS